MTDNTRELKQMLVSLGPADAVLPLRIVVGVESVSGLIERFRLDRDVLLRLL
jgi:hypothetical protein